MKRLLQRCFDPRYEASALAALTLIALIVRVGFTLASGISDPPVAWGDDDAYHRIAESIAFSGVYDDAWFPPGYPLVMAGLYKIFGPHVEVVRVFQAVIGALTCVVVYSLGKRAFGRPVGWLAAFGLALLPGHAYMSWRLMAETSYMFLLTASALLALEFVDAPNIRRGALLGLTLGLANAFKSNVILFPFALIVATALVFLRRHPIPIRPWVTLVGAFAIASLITPAGNLIASGGKSALLPANAGHTLFFANNPEANGYFADLTRTPYGKEVVATHGYAEEMATADARERDRIYLRLGVAWIQENPLPFLKLCGQKLANAFGPLPKAEVFEGNRAARLVHVVTFASVIPLALVGLLMTRRSATKLLPLHLVLASYTVMVLVFYGTPRFTLIVMPILLLFACVPLVLAGEIALRRRSA
jgi:4-amino-4-deoxy-L-arabinose transferase-like glycosyltransferase